MAVIRVHKNENYTVLSNYHFKEKGMSLKAKGLLSLMLSLPENWDYSVAGLVTLSRDGRDSVNAALKELEKFGYLRRTQAFDESGKFSGYDYEIFENPTAAKPLTEKPSTGKPLTGKQQQLNINKSITKKSITKKSNTEEEERKKENEPAGYDAIISNKINDEKVKKTIYEFIKMRQMMKKPLTDFALTKLIEKLETISSDPQTQVSVLEYSILNNYPDIYAPKAEAGEKKQDTTPNAATAALYNTDGDEINEDDVLHPFGDGVWLSENQIGDLLKRMGVAAFDLYVEKLAAYIKENGPIKSHYKTILKWYKQDAAVAR
jgi:hypothetical protein